MRSKSREAIAIEQRFSRISRLNDLQFAPGGNLPVASEENSLAEFLANYKLLGVLPEASETALVVTAQSQPQIHPIDFLERQARAVILFTTGAAVGVTMIVSAATGGIIAAYETNSFGKAAQSSGVQRIADASAMQDLGNFKIPGNSQAEIQTTGEASGLGQPSQSQGNSVQGSGKTAGESRVESVAEIDSEETIGQQAQQTQEVQPAQESVTTTDAGTVVGAPETPVATGAPVEQPPMNTPAETPAQVPAEQPQTPQPSVEIITSADQGDFVPGNYDPSDPNQNPNLDRNHPDGEAPNGKQGLGEDNTVGGFGTP